MLKTSLWEVQKALFKKLSEDVALKSKVTGVFDYVDENTKFPYVTIGDPTVVPFETKTSFGEESTIVLHCFSRYQGKKEAYEIIDLMLRAITKEPFRVNEFILFRLEVEGFNVINDIDYKTQHGIIRLKIWTNNI